MNTTYDVHPSFNIPSFAHHHDNTDATLLTSTPHHIRPNLISRRDSISSSSDTGSDSSGDSRQSYETVGTSITINDGADANGWSDDSGYYSRNDAHGYLTAARESQTLLENIHLTHERDLSTSSTLRALSTASLRANEAAIATAPTDLKPNPRRTGVRAIPTLVRQEDRRRSLVEQLVDAAAELVATIWPGSRNPGTSSASSNVHDLRYFVKEVLQRSKTSYNSLQVALWYLAKLHTCLQSDPSSSSACAKALHCGRRMLLTSLIIASKYLQDKNFSAKAWSTISGLPPQEIIANELVFLNAIDHSLHVHDSREFLPWSNIVMRCAEDIKLRNVARVRQTWSSVLQCLRCGRDLTQIRMVIDATYNKSPEDYLNSSPWLDTSSQREMFDPMTPESMDMASPMTPRLPVDIPIPTTEVSIHLDPTVMQSGTDMLDLTSSPDMCPGAPMVDTKLPTPVYTPEASGLTPRAPAVSMDVYPVSAPVQLRGANMKAVHYAVASTIDAKLPALAGTFPDTAQAALSSPAGLQESVGSTSVIYASPATYHEDSCGSHSTYSSMTDKRVESTAQSIDGLDQMEFDDLGRDFSESDSGMDQFDYTQDELEVRGMRKRAARGSKLPRGSGKKDSSARPTATTKPKKMKRCQADSRRCSKALKVARSARDFPAAYLGVV